MAQDCSALEPHVTALYEADRLSDGTGQVRHTVAFHRELVRAAGNSVLLHTWEGLGIEVFTALSIRWLGTVQQSYAEEREALVDASRRPGSADRRPGEGACAGLRAAPVTQPSAPTLTWGNPGNPRHPVPIVKAPSADFRYEEVFAFTPLIDHRSGS